RATLIKYSREVVRRQNATLEWVIRRRDAPAPLPPMTVRLPTATEILPTVTGLGTLPQTSVAPGQNLAIGLLDAKADGHTLCGLAIPFHFVWDSDRDGAANVASTVWPNLSTGLVLQAGCTGDPWASVLVGAAMYVSLLDKDQLHEARSDVVQFVDELLSGN